MLLHVSRCYNNNKGELHYPKLQQQRTVFGCNPSICAAFLVDIKHTVDHHKSFGTFHLKLEFASSQLDISAGTPPEAVFLNHNVGQTSTIPSKYKMAAPHTSREKAVVIDYY